MFNTYEKYSKYLIYGIISSSRVHCNDAWRRFLILIHIL